MEMGGKGGGTVAPVTTPTTSAAPHQFEEKFYNVTDAGCQVCLVLTCPLHWLPVIPGFLGTKTISMEPEEAVYKVDFLCYHIETRRPYGELGSVDQYNCACIKGVISGLTKEQPICPGCGCEDALVAEIADELKQRMKGRGDTGQIQRAENMLNEIMQVKAELADTNECVRLLCDHFNIEVPPPRAAEMFR